MAPFKKIVASTLTATSALAGAVAVYALTPGPRLESSADCLKNPAAAAAGLLPRGVDDVATLGKLKLPAPVPTVVEPPANPGGAPSIDSATWTGAQEVLANNWKDSYTAPSLRHASSADNPLPVQGGYRTDSGTDKYPHQWLWDSGFHTVVNADLGNLANARTELSHLLLQQHADGFIPDMSGKILGQDITLTQSPNIAVAALALAQKGELPSGAWTRLKSYYDWLDRHSDACGIFQVRSGLETGTDTSPIFDSTLGNPHGSLLERLEYKAQRAKYDGLGQIFPGDSIFRPDVNVSSVTFNSLRARDLEAMAEIARLQGNPEGAQDFQARYEQLRNSMRTSMRDPKQPFRFVDLDAQGKPLMSRTVDMFLPLQAGLLTPSEADELIGYLVNPANGFWTRYAIPSVSTTDPAFSADDYWRGPTWMNTNYLVLEGMLRYGHYDEARQLYEKSLAMLQQNDGPMRFNEDYDPVTGKAQRQGQFGWSTLIVSMQARLQAYERAHPEVLAPRGTT